MSSINRILVALDGPVERARVVLDEAADLARMSGATLVLLRTVHVVSAFAPPAAFGTQRVVSLAEEAAQRTLRSLVARVQPELVESAIVRLGTPAEAICAVAESLQADLIVIGSEPAGGFLPRFSTTYGRVVNTAPCPVIVIRDRAKRAA